MGGGGCLNDLVFSTPKTADGDEFDGCKAYNLSLQTYTAMANLSFSEAYHLLDGNSTNNSLPTTQVLSCDSGPYDWNIGAGMEYSLANEVNKAVLCEKMSTYTVIIEIFVY